MKDPYKILEVLPYASQSTIKEQYRFLVHAWHPDKFQKPEQKAKAEVKLKEINAAYKILSKPDKRAEYNNFRGSLHVKAEQKQYTDYERQQKSQQKQESSVHNRNQHSPHIDAGQKLSNEENSVFGCLFYIFLVILGLGICLLFNFGDVQLLMAFFYPLPILFQTNQDSDEKNKK